MKCFSPSDLIQGVTHCDGEEGVYIVQSKTRAGVEHRVDTSDFCGFGSCSCERMLDFGGISKLEKTQKANPSTVKIACEHLKRVWLFVFFEENIMRLTAMKARDARTKELAFQGRKVSTCSAALDLDEDERKIF